MNKITLKSLFIIPLVGGMMFPLYPRLATAEPNFSYKRSFDPTLAAKFQGMTISNEDLRKDIQRELYDAEKNIYNLKMNQLKTILLDRLIKNDPRSAEVGAETFLQKYILPSKEISDKEITDFILQQKVPQNQINQQLRDRVKAYLADQQRKTAIDKWLDESTRNNPVEIFLAPPEAPKVEIPVSKEDQTKGSDDAPVTIIEFSEFQCPYCSRAANTMQEVLAKYGDKVRLVFKNYPLPMHNNARKAAEYGLCANDQSSDKFWQLHDIMFANQNTLEEPNLLGYAQKTGLDMEKLKSCIDGGRFADKIDLDMADANRVGANSTPIFFINGTMVKGALPLTEFSAIIDRLLQK